MAIIYKATNKINGMAYIGSSPTWPPKQIRTEANAYFYKDLTKYGDEGFEWFVLLTDGTQKDIINLIEEHGTRNGYNTNEFFKRVVSERTKRKISESHKGKHISDYQRSILRLNGHRMKMRGHTDEAKAKISAAHKGKPLSLEHCKSISEGHAAYKATGAYYQSPEYKEKMRIACSGKKRTPEQRERYRLAALNRSPEHKQKLAEAKRKNNG